MSDPSGQDFCFSGLHRRSGPVGTVDAVTVVSCCKKATFSIQGIRLKVVIQRYCHNTYENANQYTGVCKYAYAYIII